MTTAIVASKPPGFANTTRTDVFHSLAQQVFCLVIHEDFRDPTVSEIRPRFVIRNMLRHDPRPSHAMTTAIGASKPLRFLRFDPDFVIRNMLRHDSRPSHDMTTAIAASNPLRFANTTRVDVFHKLAQQVFCIVIREGF
ncbi:uncharacterized protein G2W53_010296 [Senna tora]|uniref:Uncharacterized protein n=1 Tax=Senna tora TaxID=362788 RepID=A0A834X0Q2_9FABA|nr:uncharacterized protein G2W53_010296 [Senna tora]